MQYQGYAVVGHPGSFLTAKHFLQFHREYRRVLIVININPGTRGHHQLLRGQPFQVKCVSNPDLVIPAGVGKSIARITYAISDDATDGDSTDLEMRDDLGIEAVALSFIADGEVRIPATANGSVEFVEGSTFLRGDADSNGTVFALVDGLFILAWAFNGGPAPTCEDSVDIDDNGTVFALVDVLYLLEWSFSGGPVPPSPGVSTCGTDPTDDTLNCDNSGCP